MKRFLLLLLCVAALAGLVVLAARLRERLGRPAPLGSPMPAPEEPAPAPEGTVSPSVPAGDAPALDDLAEVWGIGPVFRRRLADAGIITFAHLAGADPAVVAAATGVPLYRAEDWISQAATLAAR